MKELVKIINENEAVTTSLKVAEYFGKQHAHVMERIREIIKKGVLHESNFRLLLSEYEAGHGAKRKSPYYQIDKDGFILLALGFNGDKAHQFKLQYIRAFNKAIEIIQKQSQKLLEQEKKFMQIQIADIQNQIERFNIEKAYSTYKQPNEAGHLRTMPIAYFRGEKRQTFTEWIDELGLYREFKGEFRAENEQTENGKRTEENELERISKDH